MNWKGCPVLVTGAGGFIGSHLVEELTERQAKVRGFVHYNSRNDPGLLSLIPEDLLREVEIVYGDLRDPVAVRRAVEGASVVFHLGAVISIPYSYRNPFEITETNVMGTLNVLQASQEAGIDRLIHTSSSEVYGTARSVPITESHQLQAQSPYAASKIGADKLVESFFRTYDLPAVTLRPFNTYGPRQSARAVVPAIITQALKNKVVNLGNIAPSRDLTFVSDTVDGFLGVAQAADVEGDTFNLGTGSEISIVDLARMIIRMVGRDVHIEVAKERKRPEKSEVDRLVADNSRAGERLAWAAKVSLEDGLHHTIAWISDNLDLYQVGRYEM